MTPRPILGSRAPGGFPFIHDGIRIDRPTSSGAGSTGVPGPCHRRFLARRAGKLAPCQGLTERGDRWEPYDGSVVPKGESPEQSPVSERFAESDLAAHLGAEEFPGDHQPTNLAGTGADLQELGVAGQSLERKIPHVAVSAVDLDRLEGRPGRCFRGKG